MKKIKFLIPVLTAAVLGGCGSNIADTADGGSDRLQVYTSFYAMYDFARTIGGDMIELHNLCPTGSEPHEFEPTAQDMARLTDADVFIYNGMGMEHWADSVISALDGGVTIIEASADIPNVAESCDPHVWLDPENAYAQMQAIANGFAAADPENAGYYAANLSECKTKADELDIAFSDSASEFSSRGIVVSHEAYSAMCGAYGLTQISINGIDNEEDPSPSRMAEIEDYITANDVNYIFTEPLSTSKIVDTIAADTGCGVLVLDPFEGSLEDKDYFTVMYENLEALETALR